MNPLPEVLGDLVFSFFQVYSVAIIISKNEFLILYHYIGPHAYTSDNVMICLASEFGYTEVVKLLLQDSRVDPSALDNYSIRLSSCSGHVKIVERLLQDKRVHPSLDGNIAITTASINGHIDIVKMLLAHPLFIVDVEVKYSNPIISASENNHPDIVKLLLDDGRVDPSEWDNRAIRSASTLGFGNIVVALLQDSRCLKSLNFNNHEITDMILKYGHPELILSFLQQKKI